MARLINHTIESELTLNITTYKEDGNTLVKSVKVGDVVENLRYVENNSIKTVTGKITEIVLNKIKSPSVSYSSLADTFASEVKATTIKIDASKQYESSIVLVPVMEIIEDAGVTAVKAVHSALSLKGKLISEYSDGTTDTDDLIPGDILSDVVIMNTQRGKADITGDFELVKFFYNVNTNNTITITSLILFDGKSIVRAAIERIIRVGERIEVVADTEIITEKINDPETNVIAISAVTYENAIEVSRELSIIGNQMGVSAASGARRSDVINPGGETVLAKAIQDNAGGSLKIDGVTLSYEALISAAGASELTISNSRIVGLTPPTDRSAIVHGVANAEPVLLQIEGCYFGPYTVDESSGFRIYNGFEFDSTLADGSYIKNCYFAEGVAAHNVTSFYNLAEGATFTMEGNTFEYSGNACRIGFKGDPTGVCNFNKNTWLKTDPSDNEAWAGLVIVQPYVKSTTTFEHLTINMNRNVNKTSNKQDIYVFYNPTDTNITASKMPKIFRDGRDVTTDIPVITYDDQWNVIDAKPTWVEPNGD